MKKIISLLFLVNNLCATIINDPKEVDKTKHFYAGFGIAIITGELTNQIIDRPGISAVIGGGFGILAGILKETIHDRLMNRGIYSNQDMVMTGWGAVCGAMVIRVKFDLCNKRKIEKREKEIRTKILVLE